MNSTEFAATRICMWTSKGRKKCNKICFLTSDFCTLHKPLIGGRAQCPECRQSILVEKMNRHQLICSKLTCQPEFYRKNCNVIFSGDGISSGDPSLDLRSNDCNVIEFADKILALFELHVRANIKEEQLFDATAETTQMYTEIQTGVDVAASVRWRKHRLQEASIAGHLVTKELVDKDKLTTLIDFGSGEAAISVSLAKLPFPMQYLCIERKACNNKREKRTQRKCYRAKIDLTDVDLSALLHKVETSGQEQPPIVVDSKHEEDPLSPPVVVDSKHEEDPLSPSLDACNRIVGIGKHLCGSATDLALNAMRLLHNSNCHVVRDAIPDESTSASVQSLGSRHIVGICIATCCHSNCSWELLAAREWLESVGITTVEEFKLLCKFAGMFAASDDTNTVTTTTTTQEGSAEGVVSSSIRSSSNTSSSSRAINSVVDELDDFYNDQTQTTASTELLTDVTSREYSNNEMETTRLQEKHQRLIHRLAVGRASKRLIDWGRVQFIRKYLLFSSVELIHYVDESVTPENCLILATF